MPIELTPQQQSEVDRSPGEPVAVIDPRTNTDYVIIPLEKYETLREIEEDERVQQAVRAAAFRNAVGRAEEEP